MNTTMADGARERLVAQIGEALFGQPGLTLMELAEMVKGMRSPFLLEEEPLPADMRLGSVDYLDYLNDQPSPAGQGDALDLDRVLSLADVHAEESREDGMRLLDRGGLLAFAQDVAAALAARQPVGEQPMEMRICELRHVSLKPDRPYIFTVDANCANCRADAAYAMGHPDTRPAPAVDLGQSIPSELAPVAAALKRFGDCAEDSGSEGCDIGRDWFDALTTMGLLSRTQRSPAVWTMTAEGERLLALIDSKAVGNG